MPLKRNFKFQYLFKEFKDLHEPSFLKPSSLKSSIYVIFFFEVIYEEFFCAVIFAVSFALFFSLVKADFREFLSLD